MDILFFLGHWQAAIALPLAGAERVATPLMADNTALFGRRIGRGGEQVFFGGGRIRPRGRAARRRRRSADEKKKAASPFPTAEEGRLKGKYTVRPQVLSFFYAWD